MIVTPFVYKSRAVRALKGNWQTALLVSFCATLPLTLTQLYQATQLTDLVYPSLESMQAALRAVPSQTWLILGLLGGFSLAVTPALAVGSAHYFLCRLRGEEPGLAGLFARMPQFGKALLLYLLMAVKTVLWGLLLFVPGVLAALRYAMAPYYLAQDPTLSPLAALRKSKQAMRAQKGSLFMLEISFVVWVLAAMLVQTLLMGLSAILGMVASMFIQLVMTTYLDAATAAFFLAVSTPAGVEKAQADASLWLRRAGMPGELARPFGNDDNEDGIAQDDGTEPEPQDAQDDGAAYPLGEEPERAPDAAAGTGAGPASAPPEGDSDGGGGGADGEDH